MFAGVLLSALMIGLQTRNPAPEAALDETLELAIGGDDPPLAGRGGALWIERELGFEGTLHIWSEAAFDTCLRAESPDGALLGEDDDSGGKPTPYLALDVLPGSRLRIAVAAAQSDGRGALRLRLVASPESEATREAGRRAKEIAARVRALRSAADAEGARVLLREALDELLATEGASRSRIAGDALLGFAATGFEIGDLATACRAAEAALAQRERSLPADHPLLLENRGGLAAALGRSGDLPRARVLQEQVLAGLERTLPEDHGALLAARANLAVTLGQLGESARARALEEQVLAGLERTLPADHPMILRVRLNLAGTLLAEGDLQGARALQESVLAARERTLPAEHPELLAARLSLATTLHIAGDLSAARALKEEVLAAYERSLPADHPDLLLARHNLASTLLAQGELREALALERSVLEARERTLPADHPSLLLTRSSLADMLQVAGDLREARAASEQVLASRERTLPPRHPLLIKARWSLAGILYVMDDLPGARALFESVVADFERTLSEDHPDLLAARANLAVARRKMGDLPGARACQERFLEIKARTLAPDHPDLLTAKMSLANTLGQMRELDGARALMEEVLEVRERVLEEDHPDLLAVRANLATLLKHMGELERARALEESVLAARERTLPPDNPDLLMARQNLAVTLKESGDPAAARALEEGVLAARERTLPPDHPSLLAARRNLAVTLVQLGDLPGARALLPELVDGIQRRALSAALLSPRETLEVVDSDSSRLAFALTLGEDAGPALREQLFETVETRRLVASTPARLEELFERDEELAALARSAAQARGALNDLVVGGTLGGAAGEKERVELDRRLAARDEAERSLRRALAERGVLAKPISAAALARSLPERSAAVGFLRHPSACLGESDPRIEAGEENLLAHVLRRDGTLVRVGLGAALDLERAVESWRSALGSALTARGVPLATRGGALPSELDAGRELRARLLDPVLAAAGEGLATLFVCADDLVYLVPLDALPEGDGRLGDRLRIVLEPSFGALLLPRRAASGAARLVAAGAIDYSSLPSDEPPLLALASAPVEASLRGGSTAFEPLPETAEELAVLGELFSRAFEREPTLLSGAAASKAELVRTASGARFLHLATHGWFAPESAAAIDGSGSVGPRRMGVGEMITGFAPMTLCGLALAGANEGRDSLGRVPGLLTAEELCALDLSACELAVLSACETNVGIRRAGQGIQSLQAALHAAGARTAITSLWQVDDAATRRLMERFYTYIWKEGLPKADALWRAKQDLRAAGHPVRDWAGWVLSGDPD